MAEPDRIENSNKACLGAGVNIISSFDDGTTESIFCSEWYELIVESELSLYKWRFATKIYDLGSPLVYEPENEFNVAHQIPNDVLSVDTVFINERPTHYERQQDRILTRDSEKDDVYLQYRFRADESLWNPYFRLLVIYRLATMLSFSLARRAEIAGDMKGLADEHWRRAKTEDAQAQTNQKVNLRRIVNSRAGQLDKFWRRR